MIVIYVCVCVLVTLCVCVCTIGWSEDYGGMTSYIAMDADEEVRTCTCNYFVSHESLSAPGYLMVTSTHPVAYNCL